MVISEKLQFVRALIAAMEAADSPGDKEQPHPE
jgi:hypothetical protein